MKQSRENSNYCSSPTSGDFGERLWRGATRTACCRNTSLRSLKLCGGIQEAAGAALAEALAAMPAGTAIRDRGPPGIPIQIANVCEKTQEK